MLVKYNHSMTSYKTQSQNLLHSKKISITNPRTTVLELLIKENRPLSIEELLKLSKGKLAQSTVYRVVNDLKNFGLAIDFTTPNNTLAVELKKPDLDHHHHIFCESCGRIIDIELDIEFEANLDREVKKIEKEYSLSIREHALELFGLCASCSSD